MMQDLSSTMFYKAKFTIQTVNGDSDDLLWRLVMGIRSWITSKLNKKGSPPIIDSKMSSWSYFKMGRKFFDLENLNRIYAESLHYQPTADPSTVSWACKIVEKPNPAPGFATREWTTEIGYQALSSNSAEISYVVTYSDLAGFIGFCMPAPSPSIPRVVRQLFENPDLKCTVGSSEVSLAPIKLVPGDYPEFERIIFDADRKLPIIYVSPQRISDESNESAVLVDPVKLAHAVAGNAIVYYADSFDFVHEMSYCCSSNLTSSGGTVRVYQPNIHPDDPNEQYRHRFLSSRFIEENGENSVIDIFRRAMAQDVHFYESLFRLDDCQKLIDADLHKEKIARIRAKSEGEAEEAYIAFLEESDKREEAENTARTLKKEVDRLKTENYTLDVQVKSLREQANQISEIEAANRNVRSISTYPNSPLGLAKYFETVYPDRIAFTERAYRSLDDCSTKCDMLWEVFYHIVTDLFDLLSTTPATALSEFKNRTGWDCARGEGHMTHLDSRLMRQYVDSFNGKEINIEAHIKNGVRESDPKFVRIYFAYDPNVSNKIIIGHCGKHLDNYSTRKARK